MRSPFLSLQRNRVVQCLALALVIATGLLWRSGWLPLPPFLVKYGGDSLWALAVFLGLGFTFPRGTTFRIALGAVAISWVVEFLQLYHAPWLDAIRATLPGRLILGRTFNAPDLVAYVIGVVAGAAVECVCRPAYLAPPRNAQS